MHLYSKQLPAEISSEAFPMFLHQVQTPAWDSTRPWGSGCYSLSASWEGAFQSLQRLASPSTLAHATPSSCNNPRTPPPPPIPLESQLHPAALLHALLSLITASIICCAATCTSVSLVDIGQDSHDGLISLSRSLRNCGEYPVPQRQKSVVKENLCFRV